ENLISGKERDTFILKLSLVADEDDCLEEEEEEDDYCEGEGEGGEGEGEGEGVAPDTNDNTIPLGVVVNAYPNPTTSTSVTVNFSLPLPEVTIKVSDAQGRLLHNSLYRNANDIVLPLDDLKGLYFIEMITADAKQTISVVKK
ncbi:T9SS type A sorting domain-containing protein, partial [Tenacibaculum maritimum]|uniref:T9SS type A sorting domain-containing protein n=1 Tax=Tenacibaculum maritimum TaxID=107401 RepID=UPI001E33F06C